MECRRLRKGPYLYVFFFMPKIRHEANVEHCENLTKLSDRCADGFFLHLVCMSNIFHNQTSIQ